MKLAKTHDYCGVKETKLTVVLIHGIASNSGTFGRALEYLEPRFPDIRFVTFDLLGSGKSYAGDELNYDYADQLGALHGSIEDLEVKTPLVLIGHSLGTFIVTRYADTYKKTVDRLILVSPPVYTPEDLANPAFEAGIKAFKDAVSMKDRGILETKSFNNSMEKIVLDKKNYRVLAGIKTPTTLIYGEKDQLIGAHNIPKIVAENSKYLTSVKTDGQHGVTEDKYTQVAKILEGLLHA